MDQIKRQEFQAALDGATAEELVAILAVGCTITGSHPGNIGKHSRGVYKRAIRLMRTIQAGWPERDSDFEQAIALIRREWLKRGVVA